MAKVSKKKLSFVEERDGEKSQTYFLMENSELDERVQTLLMRDAITVSLEHTSQVLNRETRAVCRLGGM